MPQPHSNSIGFDFALIDVPLQSQSVMRVVGTHQDRYAKRNSDALQHIDKARDTQRLHMISPPLLSCRIPALDCELAMHGKTPLREGLV